ncbi:MAG: hypothetical protein H7122_06375 [Chitinophagaceae bacterium]|nr:hypothetical protein [Chitinophagaceae bacterium]
MNKNFPIEYTLESGTRVIINKTAADTYDFFLKAHDKTQRQFTYVDDERPKAAWDEILDFEQLEALRKFWLRDEELI